MKTSNLSDIFPIWKIKNDVILTKRGDFAFGWELTLPEIFTISALDYKELNELFESIVERMPTYSVVHKQDWFITKEYENQSHLREGKSSLLANESAFKFLERKYVSHKCYLFIAKTNKSVTTRNSFSSLLNADLIPKENLDTRTFEDFYNLSLSIEQALNSNRNLTAKRLYQMDYHNPETGKGLLKDYFNLNSNNSVSDFDFQNGIRIGNKYCTYHSMDNLEQMPKSLSDLSTNNRFKTSFSFAFPIGLNLPFNHIYNQSIFIDDQKEIITALERRKNELGSFSMISTHNATGNQKIKEFINESKQKGRKIIRFNGNILTFANSESELNDHATKVDTELSNMGFVPRINIHDAKYLYWAGIPGNCSDLKSNLTSTMYSDQAVRLFTYETNYKNSRSPFGVTLCDRLTGYPLNVDFFFEPLKRKVIENRNAFVVGPSGSGKSFLTNKTMEHLLDAGHHIVIVDMGRSYKRLCELYKGVQIDYTDEKPLSFNPFIIDSKKLSDEKLQTLTGLIFTLWIDDQPSKDQIAVLNKLVVGYYNVLENAKGKIFPCFNTFFDYCKHKFDKLKENEQSSTGAISSIELNITDLEFFNFNSFFLVLSQYYRGGLYDYLLNAKTSLNLLDNQFVVFELENIKGNQMLQAVTSIMIMEAYLTKLFQLPGENILKVLLIEEAWKSLMNDKMAEFIKYCVKTIRKYYGSLITVTQELDDLLNNSIVKSALVGNSAIKILLDQSNYLENFKEVKALLGLTDHEAEVCLSVNKNLDPTRNYKEVFIKTGPLYKVFGVEVSDIEYAAFTTDKDEVMQIEKIQSETNDLELSLRQFSENKQLVKLKNTYN